MIAEINSSGQWAKGYVYGGRGELLAVQGEGVVRWVHQDPFTKSQRVTDTLGAVGAAIDLDPWGGETSRSWNSSQLTRKYTSYDRALNGRDEAMMRSYHAYFSRFDQPDPWDGSYDLADPQSFNRYAYVQNDPVNFVDPTGLDDIYDPIPVDGGTVYADLGVLIFVNDGGGLFGLLFGQLFEQGPFTLPTPGPLGDSGVGPQNTGQTPTPNPNCLQNAIVDANGKPSSPGIGRPFAFNPNNDLVGHDGAHALSPAGGGRVQSLAPLNGRVIYTNRQEGQGANTLYLVDVRLANGDVARYKDLSGVSVRVGQNVGTGDIIGSVRPAGDPRNYVGLHLTLVNGANYAAYKSNVRAGQPSPVGFFIDPLGPKSPVNCPGVNLTR